MTFTLGDVAYQLHDDGFTYATLEKLRKALASMDAATDGEAMAFAVFATGLRDDNPDVTEEKLRATVRVREAIRQMRPFLEAGGMVFNTPDATPGEPSTP